MGVAEVHGEGPDEPGGLATRTCLLVRSVVHAGPHPGKITQPERSMVRPRERSTQSVRGVVQPTAATYHLPMPDRSTFPQTSRRQTSSSPSTDVTVLMAAAGSGRRFGGAENKLWETLGGRPIWCQSLDALRQHPEVRRVIIAASEADRGRMEAERADAEGDVRWVTGGHDRETSVRNALMAETATDGLVAVHDAARPLVHPDDLDAVFAAARRSGAAMLATPVIGSLHRQTSDGRTVPVSRDGLFVAATPQVFAIDLLRRAFDRHNGRPATDDATLVSRTGADVTIVRGRHDNLKVTHPEDLAVAEAILAARDSRR